MFITRRQFLKYCAASAAALGLSQTDLLKLEQAMAGPVDVCDPGTIPGLGIQCPRVIWIAGANCSGCATGLLNFVAPETGFSPLGYALTPEVWTEDVPSLAAAYPLAGALDADGDGLIDIGDVAINVISIDYAYIVAGAAGDVLNTHMVNLVESGQPYILLTEGAAQLKDGRFCRIFEVPPGKTITIKASKCKAYTTDKVLAEGEDVTFIDGAAWLASQDNCLAVLCMGTCATWGGIPAAKGNKTGAQSVWFWLEKKNQLGKPICNIPGCPPHPDWVVAPILDVILRLAGVWPGGLGGFVAQLDQSLCTTAPINDPNADVAAEGRPKLTYLPMFPKDKVFCDPDTGKCPRYETGPVVTSILAAGRDPVNHPNGRCLRGVGCNGYKAGVIGVKGSCPTRMWNTHTNWCVGNNYPCQGCTDPNFPDGCAPFFLGTKGKFAGIK